MPAGYWLRVWIWIRYSLSRRRRRNWKLKKRGQYIRRTDTDWAENGLTENRLTENSLMGDGCSVRDGKDRKEGQKRLRIGIARDEAFLLLL